VEEERYGQEDVGKKSRKGEKERVDMEGEVFYEVL